ncbi:MAG: prolyl oligopeptidase family serine peptidase [Rhodomicrobium sp.]
MAENSFAFGQWPSAISAAQVAEGALRLGRVQFHGDAIYWSESRPMEKGRAPVMRWSGEGGVEELLPVPYSARSRVHEYGGGEFLIADGTLFFVNDADQDIYAAGLDKGSVASGIRRLTNLPQTRFADFTWDAGRKRLIAIGETHSSLKEKLPQNALWAIPAGEGETQPAVLLGDHDFYASPRLSADASRLAFLAWDLPHMPWDAAQLLVAEVSPDGLLGEPVPVAGGDGSACLQPEWGEDGALYFVWDADGFGNLFRWRGGGQPEQLTCLHAELSMPLWSLNAASYALLPEGKAYISFVKNGETGFAVADLGSGRVATQANILSSVSTLSASSANIAAVGMKEDEPSCIVLDTVEKKPTAAPSVVRRSSDTEIDPGYLSRPQKVEIPGGRGPVYGTLYTPKNPAVPAPTVLPPLIISLHGGPTGGAGRGLKPRTLFFTSRGFSWLDLDYSGSTGYGRAYRDRLKRNWGVADVEDTICAAQFAASSGFADPRAIFLTGGSAGGYTVLMAIATADIFRGAASYYGICDLVALQKTTHKFEQGYQSTLLGASLEQNEALYRERSAISHVGRIETPLILFQGAADNVVPKEQSIAIADALRAKKIKVEYHEFAGEGHGFRHADTIRTCLERELQFYQELLEESA